MNLELCDPDAEAIVVAYFLSAPADLRYVRGTLQPRDLGQQWTRTALLQLLHGVDAATICAALNKFQRDALAVSALTPPHGREVALVLARHLHDLGRRRRTALAHAIRVDVARWRIAEALAAGAPIPLSHIAAWNDAVTRSCP